MCQLLLCQYITQFPFFLIIYYLSFADTVIYHRRFPCDILHITKMPVLWHHHTHEQNILIICKKVDQMHLPCHSSIWEPCWAYHSSYWACSCGPPTAWPPPLPAVVWTPLHHWSSRSDAHYWSPVGAGEGTATGWQSCPCLSLNEGQLKVRRKLVRFRLLLLAWHFGLL